MPEIEVKDLQIGYYLNDRNEVIHINAIYDDDDDISYIIDTRRIKDNYMEYYGTPSTCPWSKIEILEGQIWLPNDASQEMVVITRAPKNNVLKAEGAKSRKTEKYYIEDFLNMYYLDEVPEAIQKDLEYGAHCSQCHTYNPYALKTADHLCWACQNGYNG